MDVDKQETGKYMSYVAILLSVVALLVSVIEVSFMRDEVRAQAWPFIHINESYSTDGYKIIITNKGVGPAKINAFSLLLDEEVITDLDPLIVEAIGEENAFSWNIYQTRDPSPGVMSPDEKIVVFGVPWEARTRQLVEKWSGRLSAKACYCSIFDECWKSAMDGGMPMTVSSCP